MNVFTKIEGSLRIYMWGELMEIMPTSYMIIFSHDKSLFFILDFQTYSNDVWQRALRQINLMPVLGSMKTWMFGKSTPIGQRLLLFSERRQNVQKGGVKHLEGTVLVLFDTFFLRLPERSDAVCIGKEVVAKCTFTIVLIAFFNVSCSFELFYFNFRYKKSFFFSLVNILYLRSRICKFLIR